MSAITLPEAGFVRLRHIIGDKQAKPPIPALIPVSRSTWLAGVASGRFPAPVKLGPRCVAWRWDQIKSLIETLSSEAEPRGSRP